MSLKTVRVFHLLFKSLYFENILRHTRLVLLRPFFIGIFYSIFLPMRRDAPYTFVFLLVYLTTTRPISEFKSKKAEPTLRSRNIVSIKISVVASVLPFVTERFYFLNTIFERTQASRQKACYQFHQNYKDVYFASRLCFYYLCNIVRL